MCECINGIPNGTTSSTDPAGALIASGKYSPTKISQAREMGTTEKERAMVIIDFFTNTQQLPIEVGIGVAGVWSAESNIKTWVFNKEEHDNGYAYKNKHAPDAKKFTYGGQTFYYDQANMMKFGYGKGLAQWSWERNFKFRDWYNGAGGSSYRQGGPSAIDANGAEITATTVAAQTAFAWEEMQERTGEFMSVINEIRSHPATNEVEFNNNVTKVVDAVLRGFENGGTKKMASTAQIDKYTWDGGYSGAMKKRVSRALGIAQEVKGDYSQLSYLG